MAGTSAKENQGQKRPSEPPRGSSRRARNSHHGCPSLRFGASHHGSSSRLNHTNGVDKKHIPSRKVSSTAVSAWTGESSVEPAEDHRLRLIWPLTAAHAVLQYPGDKWASGAEPDSFFAGVGES